ncbi:MAG TPA: T9SS type A sorting domain-containing protein [Bacteroidales bacterium]|nr:T9SS type A sorting domain-containing protein [Bacteroidales bacterium]HOE24335.1 T9SS type A sorting domain-containing protein [Bacteroidales bacterium]HOR09190.1 T9SS type A sorting domain-containing protein [Bacteroidales bacterium]HPK84696.1 T9SS type A sorting domain-containing protein [Bacteroidales bacterium]
MKRRLPGIILSSITCCLLIMSLSTAAGQTGDGQPAQARSAVIDSVAHSLAERIKVYPNPVRSELIADHIEGVTMIEIFDVTGNKCLNEVCDNHNQMTIEVSTLKKGIYFIRFISPGATIMKRFIKE